MKYVFVLLSFLLTTGFVKAQFTPLVQAAQPQKSKIHQFEDDGLAHFSYAILVGKQVVLVDPGRNPQPYYDFAEKHGASIIGVVETHPHADFVSSHLQIHHEKGATVYISKLAEANYPHQTFDEGDIIDLGNGVIMRAMFTPGHSPDGISVVLSEDGKDVAVFTGDTLFIGDVGRPDLRESAGAIMMQRKELARMMYYSTREKLMKLAEDVVVYPAHGAGSLCGKAISDAKSSTIGQEKLTNYALQEMNEEAFVELLLQDQPFIPQYFPYNVDLNKTGAPTYLDSKELVPVLADLADLEEGITIIDGRSQDIFKNSHLPNAINIMKGAKFETWLGSLVSPQERYYLIAESEASLDELISKAAKIGYELLIAGAGIYIEKDGMTMSFFDQETFDSNPDLFTIIDIRNEGEVAQQKVFANSINIPLPELMQRVSEIPTDKPVVVHCGTGYRSAAGSSIIQHALKDTKVIDMGAYIKEYNQK
ncbi:MBL fold metallo-hydrolase [Mongoliitalea daihaiensis]|uniref:MBL fold metallo-hydrolase n=1 Tax=Mongoliitalea daihaiensis TaxID=2782006 RepID=UPI001F39F9A6|nr:MBL fold metallo-hydrolase [Mongoliitalea daihaiensis]UJP64580.1 MBL fold metallo-hydrolase [Mongoliitalea daihaiensis]